MAKQENAHSMINSLIGWQQIKEMEDLEGLKGYYGPDGFVSEYSPKEMAYY